MSGNIVRKRPSIFIFTTAYDPFIGGAEIAVKEITKRLKDEFRFFIFTSRFRKDLPRCVEKDGIVIRRIGLGFKLDKFLIPFIGFFIVRRLAREERPVLFWPVMVSYASGIPYLINIFRPGKPIPIILTLQEGDSVEHIKRANLGLSGVSWRAALRRTHYLTAISTFLLRLGREFGYTGAGRVIPNGVDVAAFTKEFQPDELAALRNILGILPDEKVVVTTSRLSRKNAIDTAIRALGVLARKGKKLKFLVLGSGEEEQALCTLARRENISERVIFLGTVPHGDIPKYLKISDLFVRPSRSEGLGNSFLEAMAAGVPVIGTLAGGIADFLEDGKTGLAVGIDDYEDLARKIESALYDRPLRDRIRAGGHKIALAGFQWGMIADSFSEVFNAMIAEDKKLRILIATGIYPPDIGGPATYSKLLVDALPASGFRVRVLNFGEVRSLPKVARHFVYFFRLLKRARAADIIFAQDPVSVGLPSALAAKVLGKKFALKVVGDYAWEQYQQKIKNQKSKIKNLDDFQKEKLDFITELRRRIQKFVTQRAQKIIVPSEYLKKIVMQWGANEKKISAIYNAFEADTGQISKDEARSRLGLSGTVAVSAGRLVPWKGFEALIEIVAELQKDISGFKLVIIGSGPDEERLLAKVKNLGLEGVVTLVGPISHDGLLRYFRAGDVFILNTAYEGFSHTLLEAMASGLPVITTPVGGNSEIIKDGENGILVSYNDIRGITDAVRRVLSDPVLRDRLSAQERAAVGQFTKEKMLAETTAILENLL